MSKPPNDIEETAPDYCAEIRFGTVMYGGVSLAIYINGVSSELFELICATPRTGFSLSSEGKSSTRHIYSRLAWLANNRDLRESYAVLINQEIKARIGKSERICDRWDELDLTNCRRTRFVVDVISGTSAGGINGIFLAKAIANAQQFSGIQKLWIDEGDISLLLNDKSSYTDGIMKLVNRSDNPVSLLNSDRMYFKLYSAMEQMAPIKFIFPSGFDQESPLAEEIDLYVTTTDIKGSPVPLRLFDKIVWEKRFKQSYHFSHSEGITQASEGGVNGSDFLSINNAFLAFAARCTSSFPFAFEPMTLRAVSRLEAAGPAPGVARWKGFFPGLPKDEVESGEHENRAFGDGGYLDNKPFSYVVNNLSQRFSSVPVERKLVYIEPSPEHIRYEKPDGKNPPDALSNSFAALIGIPRYETMREDLQAVLERNRRIERVERIVRLGELDVGKNTDLLLATVTGESDAPNWGDQTVSQLTRNYGLAYISYHRMRVYAVTDNIADRLGKKWGIDPDSDFQYALRALVRVWRESFYDDEGKSGKKENRVRQTTAAFLDQFDIDYRLRRLSFLLRKIDQLTRLFYKRCVHELDDRLGDQAQPPDLSEVELQILDCLPEIFCKLNSSFTSEQLGLSLQALSILKRKMLEIRRALLLSNKIDGAMSGQDFTATSVRRDELLKILRLVLGEIPDTDHITVASSSLQKAIRIVLNPDALKLASISRTLQEGVRFRAGALLTAAAGEEKTPLQEALENDIEQMRIKSSSNSAHTEANLKINRISARVWLLLGKPKFTTTQSQPPEVNEAMQLVLGEAIDSKEANTQKLELDVLNTPIGQALRQFLAPYYLRFDAFDQMSFPLYYGTGTGEPTTVEVVRISPVDATSLINEETDLARRHKLAGTALGNFGAFLDRRWRLNDIMWGRLDGAERLIHAVLPMADKHTQVVRETLVERAHFAILRESLIPAGHHELTKLLVKALNETSRSEQLDVRLKKILAELSIENSEEKGRLEQVLLSIMSEAGLIDYLRNGFDVDRTLVPEATMKNAARAVAITGKMLEVISRKHGKGSLAARWIARFGLAFQGLVAVSVPGALQHRLWTHWMKVLYAFEITAFVAALFLGGGNTRTLALTALGFTVGIHVLTLVMGDVLRSRMRYLYIIAIFALTVLIAFAALGFAVIFNIPLQGK